MLNLVWKWVSCSGIHEVIDDRIGMEIDGDYCLKIEKGGEKDGL